MGCETDYVHLILIYRACDLGVGGDNNINLQFVTNYGNFGGCHNYSFRKGYFKKNYIRKGNIFTFFNFDYKMKNIIVNVNKFFIQ